MKNRVLVLILFAAFIAFSSLKAQAQVFPDHHEAQIRQLIRKMTLEEKVFQLPAEYPNSNFRLGIPNLSANECLHGIRMKQATVFPQAIAMASTWDTSLIVR